jgi:hypothetical protein
VVRVTGIEVSRISYFVFNFLFYNNEALHIVGIVWNTLERGNRLAGFWMVLITNATKAKMCDTMNIYQISV